MYELYVIPGSHACRSAMLMLDHKQVSYRVKEVVTVLHPVMARVHGFDAGGQRRDAGGHRTFGLRFGDRLATVPGLASNGQRISTNYRIARFLEAEHPRPPLFPGDPARRAAVEEAERWANDTLQMFARRILLPSALRDPAGLARATADGRLGNLLYGRYLARRLVAPMLARRVFAAAGTTEAKLLAELPAMLDRIDAWINDGVLGAEEPNVADFMVAPSLALILYRTDLLPQFEGRPALALVDRLLPEPTVV